ncbi:MAG TPA: LLM class flavin-dependent oxidoreductase [Chloroflexota bacterium]|nr:LLM class flavin-dependent oxidoreductase [Chloroflexota bacterium]
MHFSTMVLTMYVDVDDRPEDDERILDLAIEQSLLAAELGYNPFFTEHHFRGPWHSSPLQFASYLVPQLPNDVYLGFGVLSLGYYHPVRLAESMNLLDHLTKGRALFGVGSGFPGIEPPGMGLTPEHHGSSRAADEALDILPKLWAFKNGDPPYRFETEAYRGEIVRRVVPSPYRGTHPRIITTARREPALLRAARNGWPVFIGTWGSHEFLIEQLATYHQALRDANHPPAVVEDCLEWCTYDWLSVVVAESDDLAWQRAAEAREDRMRARRIAAEKHGRSTAGPSMRGGSSFGDGGDMDHIIAGSPDTVSAEVQKLLDVGVNHILVRFMGEWPGATRYISEESMRLFAAEVAPRFRDVSAVSSPAATLST